MRIFITGGTGFIGSHLIEKLIKDGHQLFCTAFSEKKKAFLHKDIGVFELKNKDINQLVFFLKEHEIDGVIHLASFVQSGNHKADDVERLIDTNLKFSVFVLEAACQAQVKWFVNTGTYWQHYNNMDYSPVNLYAATKQAFQTISQFYIDTNRIKFCTIQLFDTFGPNDTRPKIFSLWDRIASSGEELNMSAGEQIIDISFVDDIISAYVLLSTHLQNNNHEIDNGATFVVEAQKRYTLKELAVIYEQVTNCKLNINWGAKAYRDREVMTPWENGIVVPGWSAKVSVEEGIMRNKIK